MPDRASSVFINYFSCDTCGNFFQLPGELLEDATCPLCRAQVPAALCDEILPGLGVVLVHAGTGGTLKDARLTLMH
ncbi:hypothetical protein [Niveibacterium microcysteis]|uniref:Uncharacterized protein n=1 Tax=Niveibacterium microcysteis TaxID=2811415 RepID=A0ABX7M8X1_9RHOO|nr:hypothetical protein [Niveibacterium microcysteis]QSI78180.1 hypothetical protein JY500_05960 [Niveibacterium microcysteis]